jgi:DNA-binding MarR family transcriptional regulator
VRRERDKRDERQVRIGLTEAGRKLRERAGSVPRDIACAAGMPWDEVLALKTELERLRAALLRG